MARAKKDKKTEKKEGRKNKILAEVISVILIFLAAFALLSLFSYNPADPSWASTPPPGHRVQNFGGKIGAWFAESLLQAFGLMALLIPLALGYLGIRSLFPGQASRLFKRSLSGLLYLLVLSPLLILVLDTAPWRGKDFPAGGLLGELLSRFFIRYFNHTGSFILFLCLLALLLIFTTRWSLARTVAFCTKLFKNTTGLVVIRITRYRQEREQEKLKKKLAEKQEMEKSAASRPVDEEAEARAERPGRELRPAEPKKPPKKEEKPPAVRKKEEAPAEKMLLPDLRKSGDYRFPPFSLLDPGKPTEKIDREELFEKKRRIEEKLLEFKVSGEVREYHPGPVITTYEYFPDAGIKVSQVASLSEELSWPWKRKPSASSAYRANPRWALKFRITREK